MVLKKLTRFNLPVIISGYLPLGLNRLKGDLNIDSSLTKYFIVKQQL